MSKSNSVERVSIIYLDYLGITLVALHIMLMHAAHDTELKIPEDTVRYRIPYIPLALHRADQ